MMRFGLHSMVAVLGAMLLLPMLSYSQQTPGQKPSGAEAAGQKPSGTEGAAQQQPGKEKEEAPEETEEAPIEPVLSGPYPVMSKAAQDRARQIYQMFEKVETSQMWASLSEGLRRRSGKEERFTAINKKLRARMGRETKMLGDNFVPYIFAPDTVYSRLAEFSNTRAPIMLTIIVNQRGQIDMFSMHPMPTVAEGRYAGYQDQTKLRLPFDDQWLVYQGGRTVFENSYSMADDMRFSSDYVPLKDGRMFSGAGGMGSKNEDYYCFGRPILAPGDGTVVKAEQGYDDNPPGKPSGDPPDGNIVVISHGNGESSVLNHLKQNSLKVKRGDQVKAGDVIGECGNSGGGPVPHIHYQLERGAAVVLPAQFTDYIADGKPVASGEPKRGEFVKNGPAAAAATSPPASAPASGNSKKGSDAASATPATPTAKK